MILLPASLVDWLSWIISGAAPHWMRKHSTSSERKVRVMCLLARHPTLMLAARITLPTTCREGIQVAVNDKLRGYV